MNPSTLLWQDGQILPSSKATVSVMDRGFLYGETLFTTMRSYGGEIFRFKTHMDRLRQGAELLRFSLEWDDGPLLDGVESVLSANHLSDAILRLTISRGKAADSPFAIEPGIDATTLIVPRPTMPYKSLWETKGGSAVTRHGWRMADSPRYSAKTGNYLDNLMALDDARKTGADEVLFMTPQGFLAEGALSNVFVVVEGAVITPPTDLPVLSGITRQAVLEVARNLGLSVSEELIHTGKLADVDEIWVTNTGWELLPITRLNGDEVGDGSVGPVAKSIKSGLKELIKIETHS